MGVAQRLRLTLRAKRREGIPASLLGGELGLCNVFLGICERPPDQRNGNPFRIGGLSENQDIKFRHRPPFAIIYGLQKFLATHRFFTKPPFDV